MTGWEELTSTALVGTDRRPYRGDLLEAAAVEAVRRRAGARRSARTGAQTGGEPAPAEEREAVGRRAAERLMRILGGEHDRLLPEWLRAAAATGRRVPPYTLPDLLERGRRDRSIREHLGMLAGRRGRWLAALNPAWGYLLDEPTGQTWELGGSADRLAHLRALRAADPGEARRLLESTWERETPDDRAEFAALLADGLSMDDEPFLEQALDDRRREVRQAAANLLTRLPGSRLSRRMAERLAACVTITGDVIAVEAPAACDKAMERDGVRPKPPRGTGERAWWLQQIIARAPLSAWGPPGRMLEMRIPDWDADVRAAWVRAAVLQRDPGWARAMFGFDPIADLLQALPPGEQQELAARFVQGRDADSQLIMVLGGVSSPWGEELATAVLHKIIKVNATQPWNLGELVRLAGEHIDPALFPLAASYSPVEPIQQVAALLRFRADMYKELAA
ncbi:DUF5691 domain-containing protein [Nonomuraea aridisoli]|uniref:Uncharacterized protein n=1 Tax=Nonomuraea aridisoli TaxID=2070368 RepID=A0A2W2EZ46_9ACTN|nr:DUF5691 domain-containing protein [Nonomuraea aridisoli]PZG09514.1 hypothetical protein C1J01_37490 [Nonomuraea aridisoli]